MVPESENLTLLDACAVINLYATGNISEIVQCIDGSVAIASTVLQESLYLYHPEDIDPRVSIILSPLIDAGSIDVIETPTEDELSSFLDLAIDLDNGEAMTLALALHRHARVVTDDRKAIRLAPSSVLIMPTLAPVKRWFETAEISSNRQRDILLAVQTRASYVPGRSHQLHSWWDRILHQS